MEWRNLLLFQSYMQPNTALMFIISRKLSSGSPRKLSSSSHFYYYIKFIQTQNIDHMLPQLPPYTNAAFMFWNQFPNLCIYIYILLIFPSQNVIFLNIMIVLLLRCEMIKCNGSTFVLFLDELFVFLLLFYSRFCTGGQSPPYNHILVLYTPICNY